MFKNTRIKYYLFGTLLVIVLIGAGLFMFLSTLPEYNDCKKLENDCNQVCNVLMCSECLNCNITCSCHTCKNSTINMCVENICPSIFPCIGCRNMFNEQNCPDKIRSYWNASFLLGFGVCILFMIIVFGLFSVKICRC